MLHPCHLKSFVRRKWQLSRGRVDNFPISIILIRLWNNKFNFPLLSNFLLRYVVFTKSRRWSRSGGRGVEISLLSRFISLENSLVSRSLIFSSRLVGNKYPEIIKLHSSNDACDKNLRRFAMAVPIDFSWNVSGSGLTALHLSSHASAPELNADSQLLHHSCDGISNLYFIINRKIANLNVIISARVELFLARPFTCSISLESALFRLSLRCRRKFKWEIFTILVPPFSRRALSP